MSRRRPMRPCRQTVSAARGFKDWRQSEWRTRRGQSRMIDKAVRAAVEAVCIEDGMDETYKSALAALIENAMLDNLDPSDIHDLLEQIDVGDPHR